MKLLAPSSPSFVKSLNSTSAKNSGSVHVAFGLRTALVSFDFGETTVSNCFLICEDVVRFQPVPTFPTERSSTNLARLLARRANGIHLARLEQGEIGADLFKAACRMDWKAWCRNARIVDIAPALPRLDQGQEPKVAGNEPG